MTNPPDDPRFTAGIDLIGRSGARGFEIRRVEPEPGEMPVAVWTAIAEYAPRSRVNASEHAAYHVAAAVDPVRAVLVLAETIVDGAKCVHCGRPSGLDAEHFDGSDMPIDRLVCWYRFDPSTQKFVRGCAA